MAQNSYPCSTARQNFFHESIVFPNDSYDCKFGWETSFELGKNEKEKEKEMEEKWK